MLTEECVRKIYRTPLYDSESTYLSNAVEIGTKEWIDLQKNTAKKILSEFKKNKMGENLIKRFDDAFPKHLIKAQDKKNLEKMIESRRLYTSAKRALFKIKNPSEGVVEALNQASVIQSTFNRRIGAIKAKNKQQY